MVEEAEALAERLLAASLAARSRREEAQGRRIARLLDDPRGLEMVLALTDEVLRIRDPRRAALRLSEVVGAAPEFLGPIDRLLLGVGTALATRLPGAVMPLVRRRVRGELSGFVIDADERRLRRYLARRRAEGTKVNLNLLGEAILGDDEAERRLSAVLGLLRRPDVDYVSVKASSVCSQLHVEAFDFEVARVAAGLRRLYDEAGRHTPQKFVNLDMEEYRDLDLTVAAFRTVLDEPAYAGLSAGIVLQAYLPDSLGVLRDLLDWARRRHEAGGGRIKVRIVKGANLAMERVEAELGGWVQAPFVTKAEVDASYKRMLDAALDPANAASLRVGVASHNLFELSWALTVARSRGLQAMLEVEMLEGMAPSIATAVEAEAGGLLVYAPVARRRDSESVIAYLVRRFDENTGPDNFLRHQFSLAPGSATWRRERERFEASVAARHGQAVPSRRCQDRAAEDPSPPPGPVDAGRLFANEPDTDIALAANRSWAASSLRPLAELGLDVVRVHVAGAPTADLPTAPGIDPGEPGVAAYRWEQADEATARAAVAAAGPGGARWRSRSLVERAGLVARVGDALAADRGRLLGVMAADAGKTFAEGDPEVSEAIDFARWYGRAALELDRPDASFEPYRTVVVVPPWNFPLAIPAGGVLAALAAGAAVILKPAPETVATAAALVEACWAAGIPRDALQFVPCADGDAGRALITDPAVDAVVLTGSWDTARLFTGWRPDLRLHAETSGKNAIVVTAAADLDAAVGDLVRSAFGHAGQKCSAASLGILEASVYDDDRFLRQLADSVRSLRPGSARDLATTMGPLIRPPEGPLHDALLRLGPGERWLVEPRQIGANPHLWSPGVKLGVHPGSPFHLTECFGPVLGLMRAGDLQEAIAWQNQPAYGLTAGLHSLDPAEIDLWRSRVQAGNLYVNRHTTGAVVRRQPFGGWKRSVVGPAAKAGGHHYVASLGRWRASWAGSGAEFAAAVRDVAAGELAPQDPSGLVSEGNLSRHLPLRSVLVRVGAGTRAAELPLALAAAGAFGVAVTVSSGQALPAVAAEVVVEDEAALAGRIGGAGVDKLRLLGGAGDELRLAAMDAGVWVDDSAVVGAPAIEALRWVREQAVSETLHRHGNLRSRTR